MDGEQELYICMIKINQEILKMLKPTDLLVFYGKQIASKTIVISFLF